MIGDIRKFRFWCQKVLPLVYDDSLSYYETLCKVVNYLNKVIEDVNSIPDYIDGVIEEKLDDEHLRELIAEMVRQLEDAISEHNEGTNTNSSADYKIGDMLWLNNILYRVIRDIDAGDTFIVDTNIETIDFETLFNDFIDNVKHDISSHDDGSSTTATENWDKGSWIWLNDDLYEALSDIPVGNAYVFTGAGANVKHITVEEAVSDVATDLAGEVTARENADTELGGEISNVAGDLAAEVTARENADTTLAGDLANEVTARENADTDIVNTIGSLSNLDTTDKSSIVNAINEINSTGGGAIQKLNNLRILNVVEEGATGDGVTNDTTSFNNAIAKINNGDYDALYIPAGTYLIDSLTGITRGCSIFGVGSKSILKTNSNSANGIIKLSGWSYGNMHDLKIIDQYDNEGLIRIGTGNMITIENIWTEDAMEFIHFGANTDTSVNAYNATVKNIFGWVKKRFAVIYGSRSCILFDNCVINSEHDYSDSICILIDDKVGQDTVEVYNCLFQRFYNGFVVTNTASVTTSNIFLDNVIFDGIYSRSIVCNIYGKYYRLFVHNCWFSGDTGSLEAVLIQTLSGGTIAGTYINNCTAPYNYYYTMTFNDVRGIGITNCNMPTYDGAALNITNCSDVQINSNTIGADGTNTTPPSNPPFAFVATTRVLINGNRSSISYTPSGMTSYKIIGNFNIADASA